MKGYVDDIQTATVRNTDFRRVLYTGYGVVVPAGAQHNVAIPADRR